MSNNYKYYTGITSQVPFCSIPLRLDPYNHCQFSCGYCFASTRQGFGRNAKLTLGSASALEKRLERVNAGYIDSAVDEFISQRIPFQLGGMVDPFSLIEKKKGVTLAMLKVLAQWNYPVVISTKSDILSQKNYLEVLRDCQSYVRFSTTVVSPELKDRIDKGCPSMERIAKCAEVLSSNDISTSFRFQPIFPEHEQAAYELIHLARDSGVKHISAEYLKVPIDANIKFSSAVKEVMSPTPIDFYKSLGAKQKGREYILPQQYRLPHLEQLAIYTRKFGLTFGFADNDLLLLSDGKTCCAAGDLYLKDAGFFNANVVGLANNTSTGNKIIFDDLKSFWQPQKSVTNYLNSKARPKYKCFGASDWETYSRKLWLGVQGVYKPDFFLGVKQTDDIDSEGLPIFIRTLE